MLPDHLLWIWIWLFTLNCAIATREDDLNVVPTPTIYILKIQSGSISTYIVINRNYILYNTYKKTIHR